MGKVIWFEAKELYLLDTSVSYSILAKKYSVAKSTIQRRAIKEGWPELREKVLEKLHKQTMRLGVQEKAEIEDRHIRRLRMIQDIVYKQIYLIGKKTETGDASARDIRMLQYLSSTQYMAIMAERKLLGLTTKPVRISNPETLHDYQVMMGYIDDPVESHNNSETTMATLDKLIARKKMLKRLINESN
jgi:hypothetical protein